jgi:hypothetical protein
MNVRVLVLLAMLPACRSQDAQSQPAEASGPVATPGAATPIVNPVDKPLVVAAGSAENPSPVPQLVMPISLSHLAQPLGRCVAEWPSCATADPRYGRSLLERVSDCELGQLEFAGNRIGTISRVVDAAASQEIAGWLRSACAPADMGNDMDGFQCDDFQALVGEQEGSAFVALIDSAVRQRFVNDGWLDRLDAVTECGSPEIDGCPTGWKAESETVDGRTIMLAECEAAAPFLAYERPTAGFVHVSDVGNAISLTFPLASHGTLRLVPEVDGIKRAIDGRCGMRQDASTLSMSAGAAAEFACANGALIELRLNAEMSEARVTYWQNRDLREFAQAAILDGQGI